MILCIKAAGWLKMFDSICTIKNSDYVEFLHVWFMVKEMKKAYIDVSHPAGTYLAAGLLHVRDIGLHATLICVDAVEDG